MRRADWLNRLLATIREYTSVRFEFGSHDCAIFSARCVDAMTGSSLAETLNYKNKRGAFRAISKEGGLEKAVTNRLGEPVNNHNARRGDICLIDDTTLGVCRGDGIVVCSDNKLEIYPLSKAIKHWRIE